MTSFQVLSAAFRVRVRRSGSKYDGQVSTAAAHDRIDRRRQHTVLGGNHIFALNEATGVLARRDVRERDIVR